MNDFIKGVLIKSLPLIALSTFFSVVSACLSLYVVDKINKSVVDILVSGHSDNVASLIALCIMLFLSGLSSFILFSRIGIKLAYDLRDFMVKKVANSELSMIESAGSHRVYAAITNDIDSLAEAFRLSPLIIGNTLVTVFAVVYLYLLSPVVMLVSILPMSLGLLVLYFAVKKIRKYNRESRVQVDSLHKVYSEVVNGNKEIKMNMFLSNYITGEVFDSANGKVRHAGQKVSVFLGLAINLFNLMFFFSIGIVLSYASFFGGVDTKKIVGSVLVILYLRDPIGGLLNLVGPLVEGSVALKKINSLNLKKSRILLHSDKAKPISGSPVLILNDIEYEYDGESCFKLGPSSFKFRPGEVSFIVGGNGSGKTTLAKLIVGLYKPTQGEVFLEASNSLHGSERHHDVLSYSSATFSDFYILDYLANDSGILDNHEDVDDILRELNLEDVVSFSNGKFSTTDLSQGQRKRLAFVSSYISDRYICLFDEMAADQDPYFKRYFYKTLVPRLKNQNKIVIIISHDKEYFSQAENIYVFNSGVWEYHQSFLGLGTEVGNI